MAHTTKNPHWGVKQAWESFFSDPCPQDFKNAFFTKRRMFYIHMPWHMETPTMCSLFSFFPLFLGFSQALASGPDPKMHHNFKCYSQMGQTTGYVLLLISHSWHDHVCLSHSSKKWRNHTYKCSQKGQPGHLCKQDLVTRYPACGELMWVCVISCVSHDHLPHCVKNFGCIRKTVWISTEHKSRHALPG